MNNKIMTWLSEAEDDMVLVLYESRDGRHGEPTIREKLIAVIKKAVEDTYIYFDVVPVFMLERLVGSNEFNNALLSAVFEISTERPGIIYDGLGHPMQKVPYWGRMLGLKPFSLMEFVHDSDDPWEHRTIYVPSVEFDIDVSWDSHNTSMEVVEAIVDKALLRHYSRRTGFPIPLLKAAEMDLRVATRLAQVIPPDKFGMNEAFAITPAYIHKLMDIVGKGNRFTMVLDAIYKAVYGWKWPSDTFSTGVHYGSVMDAILGGLNRTATNHIWEWLRGFNAIYRLYDGRAMFRAKDLIRLGRMSSGTRLLILGTCALETQTPKDNMGYWDKRAYKIDWEKAARVLHDRDASELSPGLSRTGIKTVEGILAWYKHYGRIPKDGRLWRLGSERIKALRPNFKWFLRLKKRLDEPIEFHALLAAANIAIAWGSRSEQWIKTLYGDVTNTSVHDAGIDLDFSLEKEYLDLLWKNRKSQSLSALMHAVGRRSEWSRVGATTRMPVKEIIHRVQSLVYDGVRNGDLAVEVKHWDYTQEEFETIQEVFELNSLPSSETVPSVSAEYGHYKMYRLRKDDIRGLFLGERTNCCQHPKNVGAWCAYHGVFSPDGAFYVIEHSGQIIVQSWVWRYEDVIVFDNAESIVKNDTYLPIIQRLYKEVARKMIGKLGVDEVRIGTGNDDIRIESIGLPEVPDDEFIVPGGAMRLNLTVPDHYITVGRFVQISFYSDARDKQLLLAKRGD